MTLKQFKEKYKLQIIENPIIKAPCFKVTPDLKVQIRVPKGKSSGQAIRAFFVKKKWHIDRELSKHKRNAELKEKSLVVLEREYDKAWDWFISLNLCGKYGKKPLEKPPLVIDFHDTAWGVCWTDGSKILLNPILLEASEREMVDTILHEFCHLLVNSHTLTFWNLLDGLLKEYEGGKYYKEKQLIGN